MVTLLFTVLALNTAPGPVSVRLPSEGSFVDGFARNQAKAERSTPVPTNPLWIKRDMTMDAVNELEEGFLDFYDERTLRFITSYAGRDAEATYLFNSGRLAMVTVVIRIGKVTPWENYTECRDVLKHTRELAGQNETKTEIFPWRYTFENNVEVRGIDFALSHADYLSEWLLQDGVLTAFDGKVGVTTYMEVTYIPRKPRN